MQLLLILFIHNILQLNLFQSVLIKTKSHYFYILPVTKTPLGSICLSLKLSQL